MGKRWITAIDVGSHKVTTVIAAVEEDGSKPTVLGVYSPASQGIKKGVVVNIDEATNSISESVSGAERMAGVTVSDVLVTINGQQITSINNRGVVAVSGSEITMDDTYRAIENARTLSLPQDLNPIHILPREFVVDSQAGIKYPIGMTGQRLEVEAHIITTTMSSWKNLQKCVEQLGLSVYDIVFTGWASSLSVLTETEKELGVAMLDIGMGTTSISVFQEGAICFSGSVPLGGMNITSDLAIGLQISIEDAEKVKVNLNKIFEDKMVAKPVVSEKIPALLRKAEEPEETKKEKDEMIDISALNIPGKDKISKTLVKKIIDARLEEIFEMVKTVVSKGGFDVAQPAGVVMTGGTSLLKDITKVAQSTFSTPARVGYPKGLTGMVEEIADPAFAAVQGLIQHALVDDGGSAPRDGYSKSGGNKSGGMVKQVVNWFKSLMP